MAPLFHCAGEIFASTPALIALHGTDGRRQTAKYGAAQDGLYPATKTNAALRGAVKGRGGSAQFQRRPRNCARARQVRRSA